MEMEILLNEFVAVSPRCLARREKEALERDAGKKERGHTTAERKRSFRDLYVRILALPCVFALPSTKKTDTFRIE